MRVKPWLQGIYRKDDHVDKSLIEYRFDQSERTELYSDKFFNTFLDSIRQTDIIAYPYVLELKQKIAELNGVPVENVFLTPGSDVAIRTMFDVSVTQGSEVVSTDPCFPMYKVYSELYGAKFVGVEYTKDMEWSVDDMISKLNSNTSLVIVANPNNPIGDAKGSSALEPLVKETNRLGIPLLIDEAYDEFLMRPLHGFTLKYENVAICRTFSKGLGSAGARIGYIIAHDNLMEYISKWRLMHEVTGISARWGSYILDHPLVIDDYVKQTLKEKQKMYMLLMKAGYEVMNSNTNWIHFNDAFDNSFATKVLDSHPNFAYRGGTIVPHDPRKNWIRLTIGPDMSELPAIQELLVMGQIVGDVCNVKI